MLWVVLAMALSIAAGFEAERRAGERAFFTIVHLEITPDVGGGIVAGWAALVIAYDPFVQAPVLLLGVFGVSAAIAGLLAPAALAPQAIAGYSALALAT